MSKASDHSDMRGQYQRSKAWMLGPRAENQQRFEHHLLEAFRDYCFWRRNFHPEDAAWVEASDRLSHPFQGYEQELRDRLFELLAQLKRSVPFFSPRYLGHMNTDLLMPGVLGYVAAMLYNQNNIVEEASTLTLRLEQESMKRLARMLHLPVETSWGHLCSGGSAANTESLWVARNLRLFPYQMGLLIKEGHVQKLIQDHPGVERVLQLPVGERGTLGELCEQNRLRSVTFSEAIALHQEVKTLCSESPALAKAVESVSVSSLGLAPLFARCRDVLKDGFPRSFKVFVSTNAHYSLKKSMGILGFGSDDVVKVSLDDSFQLDIGALRGAIQEKENEGHAVLAVVGVHGSTEEGTVDDFAALAELRNESEREDRGGFWLHADACYGGYSLALTHPVSGGDELSHYLEELAVEARVPIPSGRSAVQEANARALAWSPEQSNEFIRRCLAVGDCDSVAIDPHKLGYIPYPAGAVLFRRGAVREVVKAGAPYLNAAAPKAGESLWETPYTGEFTLEGSRPGAYGAATWLAHTTVPLDRTGHGLTVAASVLGARHLKRTLARVLDGTDGVHCAFPYEQPDLNILLYTFPSEIVDGASGAKQRLPVAVLNRVVDRLYAESLPTKLNATQKQDFVIAKTGLGVKKYGEQPLKDLLEKLAIPGDVSEKKADLNPWQDADEIRFVRTVVMGPFLLEAATTQPREGQTENGHVDGDLAREYALFLRERVRELVSTILSEPLPEEDRPPLPCPVLVLEDDHATSEALVEQLNRLGFRAKGDNRAIPSVSVQDAVDLVMEQGVQAAMVDLDLGTGPETGLDFLRRMVEVPSFRGAVVFTAYTDELNRAKVKEIEGQRDNWKVVLRDKPNLNKERFQLRSNLALSALWDILYPKNNTPPSS